MPSPTKASIWAWKLSIQYAPERSFDDAKIPITTVITPRLSAGWKRFGRQRKIGLTWRAIDRERKAFVFHAGTEKGRG